MNGQYASYWNAFLFTQYFPTRKCVDLQNSTISTNAPQRIENISNKKVLHDGPELSATGGGGGTSSSSLSSIIHELPISRDLPRSKVNRRQMTCPH